MNAHASPDDPASFLPSCNSEGICAFLNIPIDGDSVLNFLLTLHLPLILAAFLIFAAGRAREQERAPDGPCCSLRVGGRLLAASALLLCCMLYGPHVISDKEIRRTRRAASETLPLLDRVFESSRAIDRGAPSPWTFFTRTWLIDSGVDSWGYGAMPTRAGGSDAPCKRRVRLGRWADGGKIVCLDDFQNERSALLPASRKPCLVVSVGSNGDFSFENGLHQLNGGCRIDTWDGTLSPGLRAPRHVQLRRSNFNASSWRQYHGRHVAILKMDCEGCELYSLIPFVHHACIDLIIVEVHNFRHRERSAVTRLMQRLNQTHALYYAEANPFGGGTPRGGCCGEYALRRRHSCVY